MKTYFAKYLPVEGKITSAPCKAWDDNILSRNKVVDIVQLFNPNTDYTNAKDSKEGIYSYAGLQKLKPVKLFLCSRDIQVGDKVRHVQGWDVIINKIEEKVEGNRQYVDTHEEANPQYNVPVFLDDLIKVIGEISPEAVWVKEGDEFDEEDVKIYAVYPNGHWEKSKLPKLAHAPKSWMIKVKCPTCKTYH